MQRETLLIATARFRGGLVTELDVDQAQSNLAQTKATIPQFEITTAAAFRLFADHPADCTLIEVGLGGLLQALRVRHRDVGLVHANHGRVELVEALALHVIDDLRADAAELPALLEDDAAVGGGPEAAVGRCAGPKLTPKARPSTLSAAARHIFTLMPYFFSKASLIGTESLVLSDV